MVDVNPEEVEPSVIIVDDDDEFLFPSGEIGTSIQDFPDDEEPIVVPQNGETVVIEVAIPGPRGLRGDPGQDGDPGVDGREVELRTNSTHLQWRWLGETSWTDLVALSELKGDQGDQGDPGPQGDDGLEVELQKTPTHIQWRYVGGSWQNLVALTDITGPAGATGGTFARGMPRTGVTDLLGVPGTNFYAVSAAAIGTRRDMNPFEVDAAILVKAFDLEVSVTGTETSVRVGIMAADKYGQPTGSVLAQATFSVASPGVKRQPITPVTLQAGRYVLMHQGQNLGTVTVRSYRAASRAVTTTMGASGIVERYRYAHTSNQALDASPWTQLVLQSFGQSFCALMEYEYV